MTDITSLSQLPPPPIGQTGVTLQSLKGLPPPPAGQTGMTLDQIKNINTQKTAKLSISDSIWSKLASVPKAIGNALTSSEQAFGNDIAAGATAILPKAVTGQDKLDQANQTKQQNINTIITQLHQAQQTGGDTSKWLQMLSDTTGQSIPTISDLYPALKKSNLQVTGDAAGTLLDILSAGTYGEAAKSAETGKLLAKTQKIAAPVVKIPASQALKEIGIKTAERAAIGGSTGYAYDVAGNLQQGKSGEEALKPGIGTVLGAGIPTVIGGIQAGVALTKDSAPRFINSLIKPKQADFSYGKDPGRTVSEMGITGNNLNDFANNIHTAKQDIGNQLGQIYSNPANADIKINADDEIAKIDAAIKNAAKGGKENQGIVTTLQNTKDALLYEHGVDADGNIVKVGTIPRDLSALSPQEAFDLKKIVAEQTKFTGKPSDDKTVNSVLKDIYGGLKEKLNSALSKNNPEITDLNQKYADLTSAELATRNRDAIVSRSNLINLPGKEILGGSGLASVLTGNPGPFLAGISAVALEKALGTTAVRTRIASWLGSESPSVISKILEQNPGIKTTLYRLVPKLSSRTGK